MSEYGTAHASGRSGLFNKCYLILLIGLLVSLAAVFLFFATVRQSHPSDRPAQKTQVVTHPVLGMS